MLMQMNSAAVSSISATINGSATVLEKGSEEERWCKEQHLANNTFEEAEGGLALSRWVEFVRVSSMHQADEIQDKLKQCTR